MSSIQGNLGPHGGGWKGVQSWCREKAGDQGSLEALSQNQDLVILQLDCDVAQEPEVNCDQGCRPPKPTAEKLKEKVGAWLGGTFPDFIVFCAPSMASETWAYCALATVEAIEKNEPVECVDAKKVKQLLRGVSSPGRKLVVGSRNQPGGFSDAAPQIKAGWLRVLQSCSQAKVFEDELYERTSGSQLG